ncbi:unnamed protein product [Bursaphelenchus okinawaensis]|uniref:Galactosylgalactosylxylosylprotein 3-beta-glucuronosyltransferase n=1 Tax=Bursaphelenchus okinawaensis TaxID=465554 RepID=A0A811KY01_9BILA|nr:unnamed protein product [Bursaphelenchus okinawaensis]CAG9115224.1 unnamed protein product [Bursaphelenchus okinawaensis]
MKANFVLNCFRQKLKKYGLILLTVVVVSLTLYYVCGKENNIEGTNYYIKLPKINFNNSFELPQKNTNDNRQIIVITPTFARSDRPADIIATAYALMNVPNVFWLLVEDHDSPALVVQNALEDKNLTYAYIAQNNTGLPCTGWSQYNAAFDYIKQNQAKFDKNAVVYLANDNDAYGLDFFEHYVRPVNRIGVWPVALTSYFLQLPLVKSNKVIGFESTLKPSKHLGVYFGGFAFHINYFFNNIPTLSTACGGLYGEECLLKQLNINLEDYEPFGIQDKKYNIQVFRRTIPYFFNRNFPKFGYLTDDVPGYEPYRFQMCDKFRMIHKMTKEEADEVALMVNKTWDMREFMPPMPAVNNAYHVSGRDITGL